VLDVISVAKTLVIKGASYMSCGVKSVPSHVQSSRPFNIGRTPQSSKEILDSSRFQEERPFFTVYCSVRDETVEMRLPRIYGGEICPVCEGQKGSGSGCCKPVIEMK